MKKIFVMLLVAVMVTCCLSGCNQGGAPTTAGGKENITIKYWKSGYGEDWLKQMVAAFEEKNPQYKVSLEISSDNAGISASFGFPDIDQTDLYFNVKNVSQYQEYCEPLNDIFDMKAEGESVTIGEKMKDSYLALEKFADGNYYNLAYGNGYVGIFYNTDIFEKYGIKEPRTTKELMLACETLWESKQKAFAHFSPVGYWEDYMAEVFAAQYDGLDYYFNTFYAAKDEAGNSPSLEVLTKKDGRYEALKVFEALCTPEYTMSGSNSFDHITCQTMWLQGEAAMMVNGTWVFYEMRSVGGLDNIKLMKTPVISSIVEKCTTITNDNQLKAVVSAVDAVSDGVKDESEYLKDGNYVINDLVVSADDWSRVKAARNTMATNAPGSSAYIPNYSDNIEGAKAFLAYMYSDEGLKLYADVLNDTLPAKLSEGEIDTSEWTAGAKQQYEVISTVEQEVSMHNASTHPIFSVAGARWKADGSVYINKFSSNNEKDRLTADSAWDMIVKTFNQHFDTWVENINK